jgi:hypothetical protein
MTPSEPGGARGVGGDGQRELATLSSPWRPSAFRQPDQSTETATRMFHCSTRSFFIWVQNLVSTRCHLNGLGFCCTSSDLNKRAPFRVGANNDQMPTKLKVPRKLAPISSILRAKPMTSTRYKALNRFEIQSTSTHTTLLSMWSQSQRTRRKCKKMLASFR